MTDALGERCDALAGPVTTLMQRCIEAQGDPRQLVQVVELIAPIRAVLSRGVDGVEQPGYRAWAAGAPAVLDRMEEAAQQGDANAVWRAFTDPSAGFSHLGDACKGYPGW